MYAFMFLGTWVASFLDDLFKSNKTLSISQLLNDEKNMINSFSITDECLKFLGAYESFSSVAYKVKGENFYTIGYGSTRIFSKDGTTSRPVLASDTVTREMAIFHKKMYYNQPNSVKSQIDKIIRDNGVVLNQRFYDMLLQVSYASGSFHRNSGFYNQYVTMLKRANKSNDLKMLGELIKDNWIAYLKRYARYSDFGLGWSRRAYASMQYVQKLDYSISTSVRVIKKPY